MSNSFEITPFSGFGNIVKESQIVFRGLLSAMSRPGELIAVKSDCNAPPPLAPLTAAACLSLFDSETSVWLDPEFRSPVVANFLSFHTGASLESQHSCATFGVIGNAREMPDLCDFYPGSAAEPENSTTLILQLPSLVGGTTIELTGPGIEGRRTICPTGLPIGFWDWWTANRRRSPMGVDVILTDEVGFLGLPRTVAWT